MISKETEKQKAFLLRKSGKSYSQIRNEVEVSKSTLSLWLRDFPLSKLQIDNLRGKNPKRIEKFRNTMRIKRELEESRSFKQFEKFIGSINNREKMIAGLYLYWGEGTKAAPYTTAITNTDPDMVKFFVKWLGLFKIRTNQLTVVLHLYKDMDVQKEIEFWSSYIRIPKSRFRKPYIKNTRLCDITYRSGFGHGTCSILYLDKELYLFVRSALKYFRMRA